MTPSGRIAKFSEILSKNLRPYTLASDEDADLVGVRWYGEGPFYRERKEAQKIRKKSHFLIRSGDVIYNKLFAWKGSFGVVPPELDGMFVSDKFPTYSLKRDLIDDSYLRWYFRHPAVWDQALLLSTGSAAISKLTLNPPKFLELTIPLPRIYEQRCVAEHIEQAYARIEEVRRQHEHSVREANALFVSTASARMKALKLGRTLGDVLIEKPRNGWSPKCDNLDDGTPVLSLSAVTGFVYRHSAFKRTSEIGTNGAHYWLRPGDILITRSNTPDLVGHAAIYDGNPSPCIYPDLMMKLQPNPCMADARFVWIWLQTTFVRDYIVEHAKGTSPTMKKISQGTVSAIPFPKDLTALDQSTMADELEGMRSRIDRLARLQTEFRDEVEQLLPSILDRAFKGEFGADFASN